jgi:hypothetical protein
MYKVERTTGLREENHKRKKNFGREGMGIKMKSEKGRKKKEKQPRRISQPHLFSKRRLDQATRGKKKEERKEKGKEIHRSIQTDTVDACNPEKMHKSISFRSAHNSKFKKT